MGSPSLRHSTLKKLRHLILKVTGTKENTTGLQLQDFCQGAGLRALRERDLDTIPDALNGRPRETLGWVMTAEKVAELVAMTG